MKIIILILSMSFSSFSYSCERIFGTWQSSKELSYSYAKGTEGVTENQFSFIEQAFGVLTITYSAKYSLQHESKSVDVIIKGKNHPLSFEEKKQPVKYLKCTNEVVVVKYLGKEAETYELHFENAETYWVNSGGKLREYFTRK